MKYEFLDERNRTRTTQITRNLPGGSQIFVVNNPRKFLSQ